MRFELSIYGENDEVLKKYETDHVRWGVLLKAVNLQEIMKGKTPIEQVSMVGEFVKSIFVGLTDEELEKADTNDVMNTFKQLLSSVGTINSGDSKNV